MGDPLHVILTNAVAPAFGEVAAAAVMHRHHHHHPQIANDPHHEIHSIPAAATDPTIAITAQTTADQVLVPSRGTTPSKMMNQWRVVPNCLHHHQLVAVVSR